MRILFALACLLTACSTEEVTTALEAASVPEAVVEMTVVPEPVPVKDEELACPSTAVDSELMTKIIEALKAKKNRHKFALWDEKYGVAKDTQQEPGNVRVVYVRNGIRYTLWHNPDYSFTSSFSGEQIPMQGHFAVWERPDGTWSDKVMETYSDTDFTGCVDFGVGDELERLMHWNDDYTPDQGLEHHSYWQERYSRAILALADVLDVR